MNNSSMRFGNLRPPFAKYTTGDNDNFIAGQGNVCYHCLKSACSACGKREDRLGCLEYILYLFGNIRKDGTKFRSAMMKYWLGGCGKNRGRYLRRSRRHDAGFCE